MELNCYALKRSKNLLFKKKESKNQLKKICPYNKKLYACKQYQRTQQQIITKSIY